MKFFLKLSLILSLALSLGSAYAAETECKDRSNSALTGSLNEVQQIMKSKDSRPQIFVTGTISKILPEDKAGLPHQKYILNLTNNLKLMIVSNLDFGRVPIQVGSTVSVCGEFKKVGAGMVHWTHFDPHGGHPDGFTIMNGKLYGDTELRR